MKELDTAETALSLKKPAKSRKKWAVYLRNNFDLYLMLLPGVIIVLVFNYIPMYGVQIAFREYVPTKGFLGSDWVGLKHFARFFESFYAGRTISNTVFLSLYSLLAGFPLPIILALMLNQVSSSKFRRIVQTITYAPNFISIMVLVGMLNVYFSPTYGLWSYVVKFFGGTPRALLAEPGTFRHFYVWSGIWQGTGYGSIIFFAALSAISLELHEAAIIDGASKLQRIWYIDIPGILPTATIMLIMSFGSLMSVGFEKAYLMQNTRNTITSEILSTYVYKVGLLDGRFSFSAAIGLFNTMINFVLLLLINMFARKVGETSLW